MTDILDSIPLGDNLILGLLREIYKTATSSPMAQNEKQKKEADERKAKLIIALMLALFAVVATEPLKVILRRNIGKYALSMLGITIASILYLTYALFLITLLGATNFGDRPITDFPLPAQFLLNKYILVAGVIFYSVLAIHVFMRGMDEYYKARGIIPQNPVQHIYRGDCLFMDSMYNKGFSQHIIWRVSEPKTCFKISVILTVITPLIGLPLLFTALSFWINEWYHVWIILGSLTFLMGQLHWGYLHKRVKITPSIPPESIERGKPWCNF